jgi:hyaluronan synthase
MLLRWARSNVRETLVTASFIFHKFRQTPKTGARINFIVSVIGLIIPQILLTGLFFCILWHPVVFLLHATFWASVSGCVPAAFYASRRYSSDALWAIAYTVFWIFALSWIIPYAIFTAGNGRWLTREIDKKSLFYSPPDVDSCSSVFASLSDNLKTVK